MGETTGTPGKSNLSAATSQTALGPSVLGWARLAVGVGLAATVSLSLLDPGSGRESVRWLLAVFGLSSSLLLISAGVSAVLPKARAEQTSPSETSPAAPDDTPVPSLGEFLVRECNLITREELARALVRQRETGRPLGETLMEMELITAEDLKRVLRVHWGLRDLWRDSPADN